MFRAMCGSRAPYHYLTLLVVPEFNEWKVLLHGSAVTIQGSRQFSEAGAKEQAVTIARQYVHEHMHEQLPILTDVEWVKATHDDWLVWSG